jgi:hypothetical protein
MNLSLKNTIEKAIHHVQPHQTHLATIDLGILAPQRL